MKTYKGFNKDMTCRGYQYEEGEEYTTDEAVKVCESGFHSCEYPLDCFGYYAPNEAIYHEVEADGDISKSDEDSKISSSHIKIGARLDIAGIVKAAIDFTMSKIKPEAKTDEDYGASSATGYKGASSATGDCGASSATGYRCSVVADNPCAIAVAWGYRGRAKGVKGSRLVLADWEGDDDFPSTERAWTLKGARMIRIDGKNYKPGTWYTMKEGKIVEWMD